MLCKLELAVFFHPNPTSLRFSFGLVVKRRIVLILSNGCHFFFWSQKRHAPKINTCIAKMTSILCHYNCFLFTKHVFQFEYIWYNTSRWFFLSDVQHIHEIIPKLGDNENNKFSREHVSGACSLQTIQNCHPLQPDNITL